MIISPFAITIFYRKIKQSPLSSDFDNLITELKQLMLVGLVNLLTISLLRLK